MPHAEHKGGGYHLPMIIEKKDYGEQQTKETYKERQSPDSGGG